MKVKIARAPMPGLISGMTISMKVRASPAPSIRAASSSSPGRIVQLQESQFLQQRDQDNLLGQGHGADEYGEEQRPPGEAFFGQRITAHGGRDTGQAHSRSADEHGVQQPGNRRAVEQLVIVAHGDGFTRREPDRHGRIDCLLGLEGSGQDPVKREDEQQRQDNQQDDPDHGVGGYLMDAVIRIVRLVFDPVRQVCSRLHKVSSFQPLSVLASLN